MREIDRTFLGIAAARSVPRHVAIARYIVILLSATILIAVAGLIMFGI